MRITKDPFVIGTNFSHDGEWSTAQQGMTFHLDPHITGAQAQAGQHYGYVTRAANFDENKNNMIEDMDHAHQYQKEGVSLAGVEGSNYKGTASSVTHVNGFKNSTIHFSDGSTVKVYVGTRTLENGDTYLDLSDSSLRTIQKHVDAHEVRMQRLTLGNFDRLVRSRFYIKGYDGKLDQPVCFVSGTMIRTTDGYAAVESLRAGDLVWTLDHGPRRIIWIGSRKVPAAVLQERPEWRPIRVSSAALTDQPDEAAVTVSPQHRILIDSPIAKRMFGQDQVLIPAKALLSLPGASVIRDDRPVEYWHILLDDHAIIDADGVLAETLYLGAGTARAMDQDSLEEIETLLPSAAAEGYAMTPARPFVTLNRGIALIRRHMKNDRPLHSRNLFASMVGSASRVGLQAEN